MSDSVQSTAYVSQKDNTKLAMWLFLGGEVIFFTTLILGYVFFRLTQPAKVYADFHQLLQHNLPVIAVNTFILIASSYMVVRSLEAIRAGRQTTLRWNLLGVLLLGAVFIGGQSVEWSALFREGVWPANSMAVAFFTVTGVHGTHVLIGILWGTIVMVNAFRGYFGKSYYLGVEMFGLYWHFVDIVWIVLFTLLYLI